MTAFVSRIKSVFICRDPEHLALFAILITAGFLRLYNINHYMRFLGDEGRDALVVLHFVRGLHLPLIGPVTSIGNMYTGPLYYYMMIPAMIATGLNPVGAAVMVALIATAAVWLVYYLGKKFFGSIAGLCAALLYAIAYIPVAHSRSSWNPHPLPFFSLLVMVGLYQLVVTKQARWLLLVGTAFAFAVEMHLLGLILAPIIILFGLWALYSYKKAGKLRSYFVWLLLTAAVFFVLFFLPLILFDIRHNFINYQSFMTFFTQREGTVNINPFNSVNKLWDTYATLYISRFLTYDNVVLGQIVSIALLIITPVVVGVAYLRRQINVGLVLVLAWLAIGIVGMSLVKSHVYDHYFGFVNPAIFLLVGLIVSFFWHNYKVLKPVAIGIMIFLAGISVAKNPLQEQAGNQLYRTQDVARFVLDKTDGQPYNFGIIAKNNYDAAYRYYFELWNKPPVPIDPQNYQVSKTSQLFVVCEINNCQPTTQPSFEIAAYGCSKIDAIYNVDGFKIYRLVPNETCAAS